MKLYFISTLLVILATAPSTFAANLRTSPHEHERGMEEEASDFMVAKNVNILQLQTTSSAAPSHAPTRKGTTSKSAAPSIKPTGKKVKITGSPSSAPSSAPQIPTSNPSSVPSVSSAPSRITNPPTSICYQGKSSLTQASIDLYDDDSYDVPDNGDHEMISKNGIMFDIVTKKSIAIQTLDIHLLTTDKVTVELYTKKNSFMGSERKKEHWTLVSSNCIVGGGENVLTTVGSFEPFRVDAGGTQALYINVLGSSTNLSNGPLASWTWKTGAKVGDIAAQNKDLWVLEGKAKWSAGLGWQPLFGRNGPVAIFDGIIGYEIFNISVPAPPPAISLPTTPIQSPTLISTFKKTETMLSTGNQVSYGCMFDLRAFNTELRVKSIDIHTSSESIVTVEIYRKVGTFSGSEQDPTAWTKVLSRSLTGKGKGVYTQVGGFPYFIMEKNQVQGFYVTQLNNALLYDNPGWVTGTVAGSSEYLSIMTGIALTYPFKAPAVDKVWNGIVYYSTPFLG